MSGRPIKRTLRPPVDRTSPRAELTASEAGRCCDEQEFRALGGLRVYKGAI